MKLVVDQASGRVDASIDGRRVRAQIDATAGDIGTLHVAASDVTLGGALEDPAAFRRAVGRVSLDADVDLAKLTAALPAGLLPAQEASGRLRLSVKAGREHPGERPDVDAEMASRDLAFVVGAGASAYASKGKDVEAALHVDGASQRARLTARVVDPKGTLALFDASATPPLDRVLRGELPSAPELRNLPVHVEVLVPRRDLKDLPALADLSSLRGDV